MCYDISFTIKIHELADYYPNLIFDDQISIDFDAVHIMGHSFANHPVIYRNREDHQVHCRLMEWGVIPHYIKEEATFEIKRKTMLNIRSERILDDPKSYWSKIKNRRCLIPITGFYEHQKVPKFTKKVPYYITLKEQPTFFIPGLYSVADLVDTETGEMVKRRSCALITRHANSVMAQIHNDGANSERMILMLPFDMANEFIKEDLTEEEYRSILNYEMPSKELLFHPVDTIRSPKPRPDGKPKNEFFEWKNLPPIQIC